MTDQLERVRSILSKVTYKPGWTIDVMLQKNPPSIYPVYIESWNRIYLTVIFKTPDVTDPKGKEIAICNQTSLTEYDLEHLSDAQIVDYFIRRVIWEAEDHEFKEWFKYDGICVFEPHPQEAKH